MFEEILKEFFGTSKTFDDLFNEVFDNKVNTDDVKDENNHSYFHSVKDKYKNGEHVSHSEKEIKDGKVIKDVNHFGNIEDKKNCKCDDNVCKCDRKLYEEKEIEKNVKDENNHSYFPKDCKCNDYSALKGISQFWEDSFRTAENALIEKDKKIAELERKLAEVTQDKEYLLMKFEQVKNVFSK